MCGICGIFGDRKIAGAELRAMTGRLAHRGPDAQGHFIERVDTKHRIGLGHRRLKVIDLSEKANQPMWDESRRVALVYNGEIYNFREIRKELEQRDWLFRTSSDTEVIIKAYLEWGIDFLDRLNGMFAIGLWDRKTRELILVRDRIGIKPLYYFHSGSIFAFASELKALTVLPEFEKELDLESLNDYFSLQYVPCPRTIFKRVFKLKPGHYLIYTNDEISITRYWHMDCSQEKIIHDRGEIEENLRFLVKDSVRKRMIADVPLGAFLSGGIDSAIIVANMAELSGQPIKTFTIGFEAEGFQDELKFARLTSKRYATDHHEEVLSVHRLIDLLPGLVYHMDEPFADHSIIPTYLVSKIARENVVVALSGDGGDENFGGYPRKYLFSKYLEYYDKFPRLFRSFTEKSLQIILPLVKKINWLPKRKIDRLMEILSIQGDKRYFSNDFIMLKSVKAAVYSESFKAALNDAFAVSIFAERPVDIFFKDKVRWAMYHDLTNYMVDDILTKVDRMSMTNSLEVRVPLLDHRLVELALQIPTRYKIRGKQTKWLLRETFKDAIPGEIFVGTKRGFGIPLRTWEEQIKEFSRDVLLANGAGSDELLDKTYIAKMLSNGDSPWALWSIFVFKLWESRYLR